MKKIFLLLILACIGQIAIGQSTTELFKFSQYNNSLMTARSAAMGGAFTSLGADVSSMSINPAGLAMYGRSEISITPSLIINNNKTTPTGVASSNFSKTNFHIGNFAGVYANGDFAIGIGYSQLADYNGSYTSNGAPQNGSMGEMFMWQLDGINYKDISTPKSPSNDFYKPFYNHIPYYWNAIMGYQAGLVDRYKDSQGKLSENQYDVWRMFDYDKGDIVEPITKITTSGSFNEFTISGAYNVKNFLYVGLTIGVPHFTYNENFSYSEIADIKNIGELDNFTMRQNLAITGSGFNFKVGVTVRPLDWLRVGVAYHSPNWMTAYEKSYNDMTVYTFNTPGKGYSDTPYLENRYKFSTPSRLLVGASATIAKRLIVSFDYERTWYKDMNYTSNINGVGLRMPNQPNIVDNDVTMIDNIDKNGNVNYKSMVKNNYNDVNNYRVGIEVQPINGLFLRAGYGYSDSPYSDKIYENIKNSYGEKVVNDFGINNAKDIKNIGSINRFSGGVGYRKKFFGIDLTYVYSKQKMMPSKNYFYPYFYNNNQSVYYIQSNGVTNNNKESHQIMATLVFKF